MCKILHVLNVESRVSPLPVTICCLLNLHSPVTICCRCHCLVFWTLIAPFSHILHRHVSPHVYIACVPLVVQITAWISYTSSSRLFLWVRISQLYELHTLECLPVSWFSPRLFTMWCCPLPVTLCVYLCPRLLSVCMCGFACVHVWCGGEDREMD